MNILLTGSTGFIGSHLKKVLPPDFLWEVSRKGDFSYKKIIIPEINSKTDWKDNLKNIDVVIHLAAVAHDREASIDLYKEINTQGTINFARQAACNGVKRFIFLSSIGVNGMKTNHDIPFTPFDKPNPHNPYSASKNDTEKELLKIGKETGLEIVIIRPTLVYGYDAPGNFGNLLWLVSKNIPLPFGSINKNKRSFVSIDNLVDLISVCIAHPDAVGQVFLVSDGEDLSTRDLVYKISCAFGQKGRLLSVPVWCCKFLGKILKKEAMVTSLVDSLQVDMSHTQKVLNWNPPKSLDESINRAVHGYRSKGEK